jgi:hypothetical protein
VDAKTTPVTSLPRCTPRQTLSGAHIRHLPPEDACAFLHRLSVQPHPPMHVALGAFEDNGSLVGVVALSGSAARRTTIHLAVTPERRRLKIGTDLLQTLVTDHPRTLGAHVQLCPSVDAYLTGSLWQCVGPDPKPAAGPHR